MDSFVKHAPQKQKSNIQVDRESEVTQDVRGQVFLYEDEPDTSLFDQFSQIMADRDRSFSGDQPPLSNPLADLENASQIEIKRKATALKNKKMNLVIDEMRKSLSSKIANEMLTSTEKIPSKEQILAERIKRKQMQIPELSFAPKEPSPSKMKQVEQPTPSQPLLDLSSTAKVVQKPGNQENSLNRLSMKLPISKLLARADVAQKRVLPAVAGLRVNSVKGEVSLDQQEFTQAGKKVTKTTLKDAQGKQINLGSSSLASPISLFPEGQAFWDQSFHGLKIDTLLWESLAHGLNLSMWAVEEPSSLKNGLSSIFNSKQVNSERSPGMLRMVLESIFAYIFNNKKLQHLLRVTYAEVNQEHIYDLLAEGNLVMSPKQLSSEPCSSVDQLLAMKAQADKFRVSQIASAAGNKGEKASYMNASNLILRLTVESASTTFDPDTDKVITSHISFVQLQNITAEALATEEAEFTLPSIQTLAASLKERELMKKNSVAEAFSLDLDPKFQSPLTAMLQDDLEERSQLVVLGSVTGKAPNPNRDHLFTFLKASAALDQRKIAQTKTVSSSMASIRADIIAKQGKVKVIEFQIRQSSRSSAGNNQSGKSFLQFQQQRKHGGTNSILSRKSAEEIDCQQKKLEKYKLINDIRKLENTILTSETVAKFIDQFDVASASNIKNRLLQDSGEPVEKATHVDRMSRRLTSAKEYLTQKEKNESEANREIMRKSIANFIRMSIRQVNQGEDSTDQIKQTIRTSIARSIKRSLYNKRANQLGQVPTDFAQREKLLQQNLTKTVFKFDKDDDKPRFSVSEMLNERRSRKEQPNIEVSNVDKQPSDLQAPAFEEGDNSFFNQELSVHKETENMDLHMSQGSNLFDQLSRASIDKQPNAVWDSIANERLDLLEEDKFNEMFSDDNLNAALNIDDTNLLENFENLDVDNIFLEGDILNLDVNLKIDVPDYLENAELKNQGTGLQNSIDQISNYIVQTAQQAQSAARDIDSSPRHGMDKIDEEDESSEEDEDLLNEDDSLLFDISKRIDTDEPEPFDVADEDSSSEERSTMPPLGQRGTIMEVPDEHNDDSFELIKRERKNKKKFMEFQRKLDHIQDKEEEHLLSTKEKLVKSIGSIKQVSQNLSLLKRIVDKSTLAKSGTKVDDKYLQQSFQGDDDSSFDMEDLNETSNLAMVDKDELFTEMAQLLKHTQSTLEDLSKEQEASAETGVQVRQTIKSIQKTITGSIRSSQARIIRRQTLKQKKRIPN